MLPRDRQGSERGYTLVEVMVVVGILAILVATAFASYVVTGERSRRVACVHNQRILDNGVMQYQIEHAGSMPADLAAVRTYVDWRGTQYARCASDQTVEFTYDPATGAVACPNHPR